MALFSELQHTSTSLSVKRLDFSHSLFAWERVLDAEASGIAFRRKTSEREILLIQKKVKRKRRK